MPSGMQPAVFDAVVDTYARASERRDTFEAYQRSDETRVRGGPSQTAFVAMIPVRV